MRCRTYAHTHFTLRISFFLQEEPYQRGGAGDGGVGQHGEPGQGRRGRGRWKGQTGEQEEILPAMVKICQVTCAYTGNSLCMQPFLVALTLF